MKPITPPPLLISAALLLWGWQTRFIIPALVMVVVLEGVRFIKIRWDFSESDVNRIADVSTILLVVALIVALNKETRHIVSTLLQWLPMVTFPLMAAQRYSEREKMPCGALLLLFRRRLTPELKQKLILDIAYPFFVLCIVSAAAVNTGKAWFYYCVVALAAWALWPIRSRRYPVSVWIVIVLICGAMGYGGYTGLYKLQRLTYRLAYRYFANKDDPFKSTTAIGEVGVLKQSDGIVFRLFPDPRVRLPLLMREASYTVFDGTTWFATHSGFEPIEALTETGIWDLHLRQGIDRPVRLSIAMTLPKGKNLLKLPGGTVRLNQLNVAGLEKNQLGAVRTESEAGFVLFSAEYDPGQAFNRPPNDTDLKIPRDETAAVEAVVRELSLRQTPEARIPSKITAYFARHFSYSLRLGGSGEHGTGLAEFLVRTRTGHCEYFASATVLLLRAAGIPARYVTGFSAGEHSALEDMIVVRQRHAHAWATAYIGGRWVAVDTTPAGWSAIEASQVSPLSSVWDFFSFLRFRFSLWRQQTTSEALSLYLIVPLGVLILLFVRRLSGKKQARRVTLEKRRKDVSDGSAEQRSDLFAVEAWLNGLGHERTPGETFRSWFDRLSVEVPTLLIPSEVQTVLMLHYRVRFGAGKPNLDDQHRLHSGVRTLLARMAAASQGANGQ